MKASVKSLSAGFFCLWIAHAEPGAAQDSSVVAGLTVTSYRSGSVLEIPASFQTKRGAVYHPSILQEDLRRLLHQHVADGFINARIESVVVRPSTGSFGWEILITVDEGMPAVLQSITFEGTHFLSEAQLHVRLGLNIGGRFTKQDLEFQLGWFLGKIHKKYLEA